MSANHIILSPWGRRALSLDDYIGLEARAQTLGAHVFVTHSRGGWTVHATNRAICESLYLVKGPLAPAIGKVLDGFRTQVDLVNEELEDLGLAGVGR